MIPTEPIGSIPRPRHLLEAVTTAGDATNPLLDALFEAAIKDTIKRFEATASPVITDGEQRKYHNFWTYCVHGLPNTAPDGFQIPFANGHTRHMPRLTAGPFRYKVYADSYLDVALRYAHVPVKQPVISPSALSLMYPAEGVAGYSRDEFIDDLLREHETEVRRCLLKGAHNVQIDFTEGRLAIWPCRGSRPKTGSALAFIPAQAATATRPTVRKSIMLSFYRLFSNCKLVISISRWQANRIESAC